MTPTEMLALHAMARAGFEHTDKPGIRFAISIAYKSILDMHALSRVETFRTHQFDVACEAFDLTKVPVGGYVQLSCADVFKLSEAHPVLVFSELARK